MADDEESQTRQTIGDAAAALATRTQLDELAVDVLTAPGMGVEASARLVAFVSGGALERGHAALTRLREITSEDARGCES